MAELVNKEKRIQSLSEVEQSSFMPTTIWIACLAYVGILKTKMFIQSY